MELSVKGAAISCGLIWSGCMLSCGVINMVSPSYGRRFLRMMSSLYPGFHASRTIPDVIVGTAYGFTDAAAAGALYAILYNRFAKSRRSVEQPRPSLQVTR